MGKPIDYPKPDLSHLMVRRMTIPPARQTLEMELLAWVREAVNVTHQPPENGISAETILMQTAQPSIDVLMHAPLRSLDGKQTVQAHFRWGRFSDGHWYIDTVSFGASLSAADLRLARQRTLKERLLDEAEMRNAEHLHLRQIVFPIKEHEQTWIHDIAIGDRIVQEAIDRAHEHAKEDAEMLNNPISPKDLMMSLVGMGVGHLLPPEIHGADRLEEEASNLSGDERLFYEESNIGQILRDERQAGARQAKKVFERVEHTKAQIGIGKELSEKEKPIGDRILGAGVESLDFLGEAAPWAKLIAGEFFDIAISNDAGRVARIRSRCYVFFVAGFIEQLTLSASATPSIRLDKKYLGLGEEAAPKVSSPGCFQTQISLLHYASDHYTDGGWAGLSYKPEVWHFPDDYKRKWNPDLLGRAMATQLHRREYLLE